MSLVFVLALTCGVVVAQNSNSSTTERPRSTNTNRAKPTPAAQAEKAAPAPKPAAAKKPTASAAAPGAEGVNAAFNELIEGIRHADVNAVTGIYWNDRRLNMFNYNGTVTKGWEQVKKNRESSYPEIKDVKLDVRDVSITMLGPSGAVVTCLWTQSQEYKGVPETASGRMTLVFKRVGAAWKAIHLHSSPDTPNPAAIPPSEQRPAASPSPTP
ncbi:MAG TPA: nuclear transport factor 2 family protein [Pyrinomonadaceae bacterium]|nr:nuclear transport factor 2 family protein [Pyrinomonadaceae bacterium]